MSKKLIWHKVLENKNELPEGRIMTVTAGAQHVSWRKAVSKY